MTVSDAKREFALRDCYWWHAEMTREIENSFPHLRSFKSGYGWQLHQFMCRLDRRQQFSLANAMIKRNSTYVEATGESMSSEESALWDSFAAFLWEPPSRQSEIQTRRRLGEKVKLATKAKLRKASVAKFIDAFGSRCFDMKLDPQWDPLFHMRCSGWVISTQLTYGRSTPELNYRQIVESEARLPHPGNPEITGPAVTLSPGGSWLVNRWQDILDDEIEEVCRALVKQAGYYLDALPKLLKGLEFCKLEIPSNPLE